MIRIAPALQINITEASDDEAVPEPERPDQSSQELGQSVQETEVQDRTIEESEAIETQDSLVPLKEPATQLLTPEKTPELISDLITMFQEELYDTLKDNSYWEIGLNISQDNVLT